MDDVVDPLDILLFFLLFLLACLYYNLKQVLFDERSVWGFPPRTINIVSVLFLPRLFLQTCPGRFLLNPRMYCLLVRVLFLVPSHISSLHWELRVNVTLQRSVMPTWLDMRIPKTQYAPTEG